MIQNKSDRRVEQTKRSSCTETDGGVQPSKSRCDTILICKKLEIEFTNEDRSNTWWYSETIIEYKSTIDTYEAYLPDHCTMVEFSSLDY